MCDMTCSGDACVIHYESISDGEEGRRDAVGVRDGRGRGTPGTAFPTGTTWRAEATGERRGTPGTAFPTEATWRAKATGTAFPTEATWQVPGTGCKN